MALLLLSSGLPVSAQSLPRSLELPGSVRDASLQAAAREGQVPPDSLQIKDFQAEVWPDGCLGLSAADEVCTQARVSGWQVSVSDGQQSWLYRTNANGRLIRRDGDRSVGSTAPGDRRSLLNPATSTAPTPAERQRPDARITPRNNQVTITFVNRTAAAITFEVIGDTTPRTLVGNSSTRLIDLGLPTTVTLRRQDGGLLKISPQPQGLTGDLEVLLDEETDLGRDRTALSVEPDGRVFLN